MTQSPNFVPGSAETDFLEYRRSGDPAALARVFDQIAPELLLVAAHLVGGGRGAATEAEDLLQSTFLAAIESAGRYDAARPLRGWLVGILAHMAQRARRERRRTPDPTRVTLVEPIAPEQLVADAEFAERFQRALAALPQPYRNVLTLRLVHGLRPLAIAHAHGVPPTTVRTQLRRGLMILRQALPAGFSLQSLLVLARSQGLAGLRTTVLAHAQAWAQRTTASATAAHPAASAPAAPAEAMRRTTAATRPALLAGLVLAVGTAFWVVLPSEGPPATPPAVAQAQAAPPPMGAAAPDRAAALRTPALPPPASATALASLELRLRFDPDQAPAAGVALLLFQDHASDADLCERSGVTDDQGHFRVAGLAPGDYTVEFDRAPSLGLTLPAAGRVTRDVLLPAGVDVVGKVVDGSGQAVAGARVLLSRDTFRDLSLPVATTGTDGRFGLRNVASGRWLSALAPGFRPAPARQLPATGSARIKLTLDEPGLAVRGQVVDQGGAPLAGAHVLLGRMSLSLARQESHDATWRPPLELRTDADGRFATACAGPLHPELLLWVRAPDHLLWRQVLGATDLEHELRITLAPGARVVGTVTDGDAVPIADAQVRALPTRAQLPDADAAPLWATPRCTVDAQGAYRLSGVPPGEVTIRADTAADRVTQGTVQTQSGTTAHLDLALVDRHALHGWLCDENGAPLPGFEVQARAEGSGVERPKVLTDAHGRFAIAHCTAEPHTLEVWEPASAWRVPARSWTALQPGSMPFLLTLPTVRRATATVRGQVRDEHGGPAAVSVVLAWPGMDGHLTHTEPETGAFRAGPLPPGRYVALVRLRNDVLAVLGSFTLHAQETVELPAVALPRTGTLVLRAAPAAGAAEAGSVQVFARDGTALTTVLLRSDPLTLRLPPGAYLLSGAGAWPRRMLAVTVRSDEAQDVTLRPEPGVRQGLRLLEATPPVCLELTDLDGPADAPWRQTLFLDVPVGQPGVRPTLPRGRFQVRVTDSLGRSAVTVVSIDDVARAPADLSLTLR